MGYAITVTTTKTLFKKEHIKTCKQENKKHKSDLPLPNTLTINDHAEDPESAPMRQKQI